jgi:DnaJ-domain-containing protein 1
MTNEQTDALLRLLERYVVLEEARLALTYTQLQVRNDLDARQTAAIEEQAKGLKVSADVRSAPNAERT